MADTNDSSISFSQSDDSSMNSDSESFLNTPQITIRRPIDVSVTPAQASLNSNSSPYPRDASSSPFQIVTPVIITPVEARSTREIVRVGRMRRFRRRQESRAVLNSIRRRLSIATIGEIRTEIQMNTPGILPRSKRIDKTATAIELETSDAFQMMLSAEYENSSFNQKTEMEIIPSDSSNCAKMREINRLEAMSLAKMSLENGCETEILEALDVLEWNMSQMASETEIIDRILEDFEEEKQKKQTKWAQIELILSLIREE